MKVNHNREISFNHPSQVEGEKQTTSKASLVTQRAHTFIHGDQATQSKIHTVSKENFAPNVQKFPAVDAGKLASSMKKKEVHE